MTLSGGPEPEVLKGALVSANFLHILGGAPVLGRGFLPEEDKPGGPPIVLVSSGLWQSRFGGDPLIAGKVVTLDATPYTIIGVLPAGFQFPFAGVDVWLPKLSPCPARCLYLRLPPPFFGGEPAQIGHAGASNTPRP